MSDTTIALAGNPNCGKTTLFNRLTGLRQQVGNYPGVTVERRMGSMALADRTISVIDLPGAYSLVSRSRDEAIVFEALTGRAGPPPDAVVVVVDATNLERNLYLAASVLELGLPSLVAVNMMDALEGTGKTVDLESLSRSLGVPVVGVSAKLNRGLEALKESLKDLLDKAEGPPPRPWRLDREGEAVIKAARAATSRPDRPAGVPDGHIVWALSSWAASQPDDLDNPLEGQEDLQRAVETARQELTVPPETFAAQVIEARYGIARTAAADAVQSTPTPTEDFTDRVDRYVLHPVLGSLIFIGIMAVVFQSVFAWATPMMDAIEWAVGAVQDATYSALPAGALRDLVVHGVVGGVGNVVVFVPQIGILFAFIALLEDSGYLARAAFISDRLMARVGLHGRAFVPLLSGFACAVPAIMATRTIETRRDRLVTILVAPLVSCSARLPVYTLIIAALFASDTRILGVFTVGGLMMLGMYALSLIFTVGVAFILKRTILASPTPPLVLELPPYRRPELSSILLRAYERCAVFVRDAGTVILACSIILWALLYFPREVQLPFEPTEEVARIEATHAAGTDARQEALDALDVRVESERLRHSFAGRIGHAIEPVIAPLGYDWKIGVGLLASFAAREVFVSTMGLVYGIGEDVGEDSLSLRQKILNERHESTGAPVYTPLVGLSLMVFFALALQCMSTVATIRRETNSWVWPVVAVGYTAALAWLAAFLVYQGGRLLGYA